MILFTDLQIKGVLMEIYVYVYAFQGFKIAAAKISCSLAGQLLYVAIGHKKGSRARRIINYKKTVDSSRGHRSCLSSDSTAVQEHHLLT